MEAWAEREAARVQRLTESDLRYAIIAEGVPGDQTDGRGDLSTVRLHSALTTWRREPTRKIIRP